MNVLLRVVILELGAALVFGQSAKQGEPANVSKQPVMLTSTFYKEVVARHPRGIPESGDMKVFAPYLSKGLLHRIELAKACYDDWIRRHSAPNLKAPFGWPESGLFSGDDEQSSPSSFEIEKTQSEKDGASRVYVKLTLKEPPPEIWYVAAIVVKENDRFVIDDVVFLKDKNRPVDSRLSQYLSAGCDGPRWVGRRTGL